MNIKRIQLEKKMTEEKNPGFKPSKDDYFVKKKKEKEKKRREIFKLLSGSEWRLEHYITLHYCYEESGATK